LQNRIKIDETDAAILKTLLKESRTSFTEIAKNCKITVGAVRMRYKRLWKTGVINGEIMQVNPNSLGYKCICDIGITAAAENEQKIIDFLKSKNYITHVFGPFGKYTIGAKVALYDTQKLAGIIADIESNSYIKHADSLIWAEAVDIDHVENLVISPSMREHERIPAQQGAPANVAQVQIDEIDRKIAKILSEKSRMSFRKIAQQLGLSVKNVVQRYRKLRGNVLTLSSITVDLKKLGYNAMAHVLIKVANRSKTLEVRTQLLQIPNLLVAIRYIGSYDLFVLVALKDFEELFKVTEHIRRIQDIDVADVFVMKNFPAWPLNLFASLL
jgi:Lrp/AsnC family transcriptional regulator for asnA, asnC and gidA